MNDVAVLVDHDVRGSKSFIHVRFNALTQMLCTDVTGAGCFTFEREGCAVTQLRGQPDSLVDVLLDPENAMLLIESGEHLVKLADIFGHAEEEVARRLKCVIKYFSSLFLHIGAKINQKIPA